MSSAALHRSYGRHDFLASPEREDLYGQEGYRDSENSCDEVTYDVRETEHVVKNHYDDVLDDIVWNIGYGKFHIAGELHGSMKDDDAVEPVGDEIAGYVAAVEGYVAVGNQEGIEPGEKGSIEGVDAADNEKQQEFTGEEMVPDLFDDMQAEGSFHMILLVLWPEMKVLSMPERQCDM